MKIEKLPSGSYRVRQTYKRKTYSVTFDYKPTQKEALEGMAKKLNRQTTSHARTFAHCFKSYIESKSNVLSPATIRGYNSCYRSIPQWFVDSRISDITQEDIQIVINEHAKTHKPKSTRNMHGLISTIFGAYEPDMVIRTTLPQKEKENVHIPSDSEIKLLLWEAKGTPYEIPILLGLYGMRRSEICALTIDDLDGNTLHINKAVVLNDSNEWVVKNTKTTESTRDIYVPDELANKIRNQGYIFNGHPNSIYKWMWKKEKELGLKHFSFHKLRHFYVSMSHSIGIPDSYIQEACGFKTDNVMRTIYRHALDDKKLDEQKKASSHLENLMPIS